MKFRALSCAFVLATLSLPCLAARLHIADLNNIVRISDPQISPNGDSVVFVVAHTNLKKDRSDSEIAIIDLATHQMRILSRRPDASFPRWSPDGKTLAFLAEGAAPSGDKPSNNNDKTLQIFLLPMHHSGDSVQLTYSPTDVEQLSWRPDSKAIAYVAQDKRPKRKGEAKYLDAFQVGNNDFLQRASTMPAHIWLIHLPASLGAASMPKPKRLTSGSWSLPISMPPGPPASPLQWSSDGKNIYFVKVPTPNSGDMEQSTIQILNVATGKFRPFNADKKLDGFPLISPDGSQIAYLRNLHGESWNELAVHVAPASGGEGQNITRTLDRNIFREIWMPNGKSLLVSGHNATSAALWIQPTNGGPAQRVNTGDVNPSEFFWLDAGVGPHGAIAFAGSTPTDPNELFYISPDHGAPVQLTHFNSEFAKFDLAKQETITWPSLPGGPLSDGVLTYPIGYQPGKKYPLVLYIHGGPTYASLQTWTSFSQLFAAQGWLVFEPNYRGSDNLGNTYQAAIWNDAGQGPGEDVMAGLAKLEKMGIVDEKNIAVSGWSYGGFMTSWLLGHSAIWKASVDGAAVNNWLDMYNLSDGNVSTADNFGGSPYTSPARMKAYMDQSPIHYVANVRTPTLIMSDVGDYRVPPMQSYEFYHALKDNHVTVKFIAYPVTGHFPDDPIRRQDIYRRWIQWLGKYLPTAPGAEASPKAN
jgi:dipeptidyl aminopeptidase/acylaminoacyl peptidase